MSVILSVSQAPFEPEAAETPPLSVVCDIDRFGSKPHKIGSISGGTGAVLKVSALALLTAAYRYATDLRIQNLPSPLTLEFLSRSLQCLPITKANASEWLGRSKSRYRLRRWFGGVILSVRSGFHAVRNPELR
jgi:hypothetical protein